MMNRKRIITGVLAICMMCFIFYMSSRTAVESDGISKTLERYVFSRLGYSGEDAYVMSLRYDWLVRKAAHFTEFCILGMILYLLTQRYLIAILIGGGVGACDELSQLLSDGRSCQLSDVLIDLSGVILGVTVICLILRWITQIRMKKDRNSI